MMRLHAHARNDNEWEDREMVLCFNVRNGSKRDTAEEPSAARRGVLLGYQHVPGVNCQSDGCFVRTAADQLDTMHIGRLSLDI